jgi:hypothetical protein
MNKQTVRGIDALRTIGSGGAAVLTRSVTAPALLVAPRRSSTVCAPLAGSV